MKFLPKFAVLSVIIIYFASACTQENSHRSVVTPPQDETVLYDYIFFEQNFNSEQFGADADPRGWTVIEDVAQYNVIQPVGAGFHDNKFTTPSLLITDNQIRSHVEATRKFHRGIAEGRFEFDVYIGHANNIYTARYFIILEDENGNDLMSLNIYSNSSEWSYHLEGHKELGAWPKYSPGEQAHIKLEFTKDQILIYTNNTLLGTILKEIAPVHQIHILTTDPAGGGECHIDNMILREGLARIEQETFDSYPANSKPNDNWTIQDDPVLYNVIKVVAPHFHNNNYTTNSLLVSDNQIDLKVDANKSLNQNIRRHGVIEFDAFVNVGPDPYVGEYLINLTDLDGESIYGCRIVAEKGRWTVWPMSGHGYTQPWYSYSSDSRLHLKIEFIDGKIYYFLGGNQHVKELQENSSSDIKSIRIATKESSGGGELYIDNLAIYGKPTFHYHDRKAFYYHQPITYAGDIPAKGYSNGDQVTFGAITRVDGLSDTTGGFDGYIQLLRLSGQMTVDPDVDISYSSYLPYSSTVGHYFIRWVEISVQINKPTLDPEVECTNIRYGYEFYHTDEEVETSELLDVLTNIITTGIGDVLAFPYKTLWKVSVKTIQYFDTSLMTLTESCVNNNLMTWRYERKKPLFLHQGLEEIDKLGFDLYLVPKFGEAYDDHQFRIMYHFMVAKEEVTNRMNYLGHTYTSRTWSDEKLFTFTEFFEMTRNQP